MIVVRVELWPLGDESRKTELACAEIYNDASGTNSKGNYVYNLFHKGRAFRSGKVTGFPRLRLNSWDLLFCALRDAVGHRNERKL